LNTSVSVSGFPNTLASATADVVSGSNINNSVIQESEQERDGAREADSGVVREGERLLEAIDLCEAELELFSSDQSANELSGAVIVESEHQYLKRKRASNPLLLGLDPLRYLLKILREIK